MCNNSCTLSDRFEELSRKLDSCSPEELHTVAEEILSLAEELLEQLQKKDDDFKNLSALLS